MKKLFGKKSYLLLCAVLLLWLINYFYGQYSAKDTQATPTESVRAKNVDVQLAAGRPEVVVLKMSFTLSQNIAKNESVQPTTKHQQEAVLSLSFLLSQANALEVGVPQSAAATEKKTSARQSAERREEMVLNIEKLSRQKLELPDGDPFVAKLPPPPPPPPPAPPPPPPVPQAPAFPYTFMGRMVENDTTTLFLTKQNQSYSVKLNGVLEQNYRVDKIDNDQVMFTYLPLNIPQTLYIGRAG